jgi:hypothetical protein
MPEKSGFTLAILPNSGKKGRQYDFSGWKLAMLRAGVILFFVLVAAGIVTLALGLTSTTAIERLSGEVSVLRDSLERMTDFEIRLGEIQREIEEIREARRTIENLLEMSAGQGSL